MLEFMGARRWRIKKPVFEYRCRHVVRKLGHNVIDHRLMCRYSHTKKIPHSIMSWKCSGTHVVDTVRKSSSSCSCLHRQLRRARCDDADFRAKCNRSVSVDGCGDMLRRKLAGWKILAARGDLGSK